MTDPVMFELGDDVMFGLGDDAVAEIRINRPDKLNALNMGAFEGLHRAAGAAADAVAERRCRAVLVTGAGRAFSAGLDLAVLGEQAAGATPGDDQISQMQQAFTAFEDLDVPTVAAVKGPTLGAGAQLAIACHLRISAPELSFGLLEVRWGLIPDLGATWRLPRLIGLGRATELAVSARTIDAQTALAWGITSVVLGDDFDAEARRYAAELAAGPTVALGAIPKLMRDSMSLDRDAVLAAERAAQQACLTSADFRAAAAAGRDRPAFEGR